MRVAIGERVGVPITLRTSGAVQGLYVAFTWDSTVVRPVTLVSGGFLDQAGGVALSPRPGVVDAVLLGARTQGLTGEGVVAVVTFEAVAAGSPQIKVATVDARDAANRRVGVRLVVNAQYVEGGSSCTHTSSHRTIARGSGSDRTGSTSRDWTR